METKNRASCYFIITGLFFKEFMGVSPAQFSNTLQLPWTPNSEQNY